MCYLFLFATICIVKLRFHTERKKVSILKTNNKIYVGIVLSGYIIINNNSVALVRERTILKAIY
jgi:hypothetical protein